MKAAMKRSLIIIMFMLSTGLSWAQVPNWNEWFKQKKTQRKYLVQQIAALQVYLEYLKKGYQIADKGLTTIGDIKNGTFNLDKDYFNSLKYVNPVVRKSPKVNEVLVYQHYILEGMHKLATDCIRDENFSADEINYIQAIRKKMLEECNNSMAELTLITTSGEAEMKDDERLLRLDKVHDEMQDKYAFTQDFIQSTQLLSRQRSKEKNQIRSSQQLFNEI
jgi:hypothetical protein